MSEFADAGGRSMFRQCLEVFVSCDRHTNPAVSFQSAQNQSQLAEVVIVKCLLGLGRIF